ncbi:MAG: hypothetical protein IJF59_01325, partial [Clostridia bacterium]|nr:hypothetical protein [Clostridia bacterium]
ALMQRLHYTAGLRVVPDRAYSRRELRAFYEEDLAAEIEHDRQLHETPPDFSMRERMLDPDRFRSEHFLFHNEETGEFYHPATVEEAREVLEHNFREQLRQFEERPPFDPKPTEECFRHSYRGALRHAARRFPDWVRESVDRRLLALNRVPEWVFRQLSQEEQANRKEYARIEEEARQVLTGQELPESLPYPFPFHDAAVISFQRLDSEAALVVLPCGLWPDRESPFCTLHFSGVRCVEREKGFRIVARQDASGETVSSCRYLYDELYKTEEGYELHLLLGTPSGLRCLTVFSEQLEVLEGIVPLREDLR